MLRRVLSLTSLLGLLLILVSGSALAQYQLTTLDSNQVKQSTNTADPLIVNAWGLARSPGSPWFAGDVGGSNISCGFRRGCLHDGSNDHADD